MLLKKLGDDRILLGQLFLCRVELGFQIPFVDAIFGGLKGLLPVLEQLTLPLVEHADLDPHLLADRGDRHAFHKVPPDRPDLLLAVKVPPRLPVLAHRQPSSSVSPYYATDFGDCPFPREAAHLLRDSSIQATILVAAISVFSAQSRMKSTTSSRVSGGVHRALNSPQDFFLASHAPQEARR